jgi:hypothetical protein
MGDTIQFWKQKTSEAGLLNNNSSFRCYQIHIYQMYDFGHTFVLLKSDLGVQQTHLSWVLLHMKLKAKFLTLVLS